MNEPHPNNGADDPQLREKRILDFLPMVRYIVGRLGLRPTSNLDLEDLFEVGVMGLIRAANSYREDKNASFKTHAYHQIRGAILDEVRKNNPLSRSKREKLKEMREATQNLERELGQPPSHEQLAEALSLDPKELDDLLIDARALQILSLDECMSSDRADDGYMRAFTCPRSRTPEELAMALEQKRLLVDEIEKLPEVERRVILLYYHEGLLLKEIGSLLNKSESRISQIHSRALFNLGSRLESRRSFRQTREERDGRSDSSPERLTGV